MKLKFLCTKLSGTGGTETVLVKVLNHLVTQNEVELVLADEPVKYEWLDKLDQKIKVKIYAGRFEKLIKVAQLFLSADKNTCFISLSPKIIKLGAKIKQLLHKHYTLLSWIHFSLADQDMFDAANTIPLADGHLAISSPIKSELMKYGVPEEKIRLVYNPIEPESAELPSYADDKSHFFYAGRLMLAGQKNLGELLTGVAHFDGALLDMYGTGVDAKKCEHKANELGIADRVTWHGWTPDLWQKIKQRPTALVMTSTYEGLPMIMLEAIARGIPVVSSRFNGYRDVLKDGENGFTYDVGDLAGLEQALHAVAQTTFEPQAVKQSIAPFYLENYFANLEQALVELARN